MSGQFVTLIISNGIACIEDMYLETPSLQLSHAWFKRKTLIYINLVSTHKCTDQYCIGIICEIEAGNIPQLHTELTPTSIVTALRYMFMCIIFTIYRDAINI